MSSFNKVIIMGRLTRDLDLRTTNDGNSMVELGIAINERRLGANGLIVFNSWTLHFGIAKRK